MADDAEMKFMAAEITKLEHIIDEREEEIARLRAAITSIYIRGYKTSAAVAVAEVCDTELDRSGRLLGEIREASRKLKGYS